MKRALMGGRPAGTPPTRKWHLTMRVGAAVASAYLLAACAASAERQAAHDAELERHASLDIDRICDLPEKQRESELDRIKQQTGLALVCGNK